MLYPGKGERGIELKIIQDFNMDMLANSIWWLYSNHRSMVAKIIKSKYYPKTNVLQAKIGGHT